MKRPKSLYYVLVEEILFQHDLASSKDLKTISDRIEKEGESFLSITLPSLGAALETALEDGFLTRQSCPGFGHDRRGTLPRLFGGLFRKIFSKSGTILPDACPDAIYGIRQLCNWFKKPKASCTPSREREAVAKYRKTEEDLKRFRDICSTDDPIMTQVSNILWGGSIFSDLSPEKLIPRHGPGATAEKLSANSRYEIRTWYKRSEPCFPVDLYCSPNIGDVESMDRISLLDEECELPVRVVLVPKTVKTPRVIAIEPSHVQYMQQGLMLYLTEKIETHRLTKESIRFRDQSVNNDGARRASLDRKRATLDLSDASDRVHYELVRNIFKNSPLLPYLEQSRSRKALLPDSETPLEIEKFASMGSAVCFPVEAMVFYTLIHVALHYYSGLTPTFASIAKFSRDIDVYGDDIIVPTWSRRIVQTALEAVGLKVNEKKSFSRGFFRESCGGDYYKGYDVTPIYLRHQCPDELHHFDSTQVMSLVETSNQLYKKGLWKSCQHLRTILERGLRTSIPRTPYKGAGLTWYSACFMTKLHWCQEHQGYVQKRIVYEPKKIGDVASETGKLMKALLSLSHRRGSKSSSFELDFDRSVKRGVFKMKRRWVSATIG